MNDETQSVRLWYDETAETFSARYTGTSGEFWRSFEEELALSLLGAAGRVLDLGCGPGRLSKTLIEHGAAVVGVDLSMAMLALARTAGDRDASYSVMDATRLGFSSASFDAVISLGMFEYMADPTPFIDEIVRVLRPGGRVIFTSHNVVALPTRVWLFATSALSFLRKRARAEARTQFFRPVAHRAEDMLRLLTGLGLVNATYRGFHFPPAAGSFRLAARIPVASLSRAGKSVAVALDRWIGASRVTRRMSPLAMYTAQKPA